MLKQCKVKHAARDMKGTPSKITAKLLLSQLTELLTYEPILSSLRDPLKVRSVYKNQFFLCGATVSKEINKTTAAVQPQ